MNVSKLTCVAVNEAIARLRGGLTLREIESGHADYCHDWAACGPCLTEMAAASGTGVQIWYNRGWHCLATAPDQDRPRGQGVEAPEAVARAYLAWKQEATP